jgi:hypothetical protein
VYGTTYVPGAVIDLYLNNNTIQVFRWGLVARAISLHSTGSTSSLINAVIDVPDDAPAPFALPSAQYLKVYVCGDGATSCATGGQLALTVKLEVSGTLPRTVTILSWSVQ